MTLNINTQKIVIGVLAVAVGYLLYKSNSSSTPAPVLSNSKDTAPQGNQSAPTSSNTPAPTPSSNAVNNPTDLRALVDSINAQYLADKQNKASADGLYYRN